MVYLTHQQSANTNMFKNHYIQKNIIKEVMPDNFIINKPQKAPADRVYQVSDRFREDAIMLASGNEPFFEQRSGKCYCKLIGGKSLDKITLIDDILAFNYSVFEMQEKAILKEIAQKKIAKRVRGLESNIKEYQLLDKVDGFDLIIRLNSTDRSNKNNLHVSSVVKDNLIAVFFLSGKNLKRTILVKQ